MVATTTTPVDIEPPFKDAPMDDKGAAFSQTWAAFFTDLTDRLALVTQRLGIAEGDIAAGGGGITDGSDAPAGHVGEYMSHTSGSVALTNGALVNVVSLDLAAGDWDVSGSVTFAASSGTHQLFGAGVGGLDTFSSATFPAAAINMAISTALHRYNVTATTTVWVVAEAFFTGTVTATGLIRARRTR